MWWYYHHFYYHVVLNQLQIFLSLFRMEHLIIYVTRNVIGYVDKNAKALLIPSSLYWHVQVRFKYKGLYQR